ncbi:Uncharacterized protein OBRU01_02740 [Operophtera brumata]|uniref:DUF8040 domain-containing protein n=1 Tax=Operophtera brumata TaxID=104452 RepID=A0A0L7LSN8_OPEBR|nr:Uncharacterized protein OBRU01_02740 [Operophtera brumata]
MSLEHKGLLCVAHVASHIIQALFYVFVLRQTMEQMFQEMLNEDSGEFQNFCRMSPNDFDFLLSKVEPLIKKQKTRLRIPIPAKVRLAITLRFLATGDSYRSLHYLFKVSSAAISIIVQDVCNAINTVLKDQIKVRN